MSSIRRCKGVLYSRANCGTGWRRRKDLFLLTGWRGKDTRAINLPYDKREWRWKASPRTHNIYIDARQSFELGKHMSDLSGLTTWRSGGVASTAFFCLPLTILMRRYGVHEEYECFEYIF